MRPSVLLAALAAAAILTPLAVLSLRLSGSVTPADRREVVLGVDQQHTSSLTITATRGKGKLLFAVENTGDHGLGILVPSDWKRTEVRGIAIDALVIDPPVLGMRRVNLPVGTGVTFAANFPPVLRLHAAGSAPLKVTFIAVDLDTGTSSRDVRLGQQSTMTLWGE